MRVKTVVTFKDLKEKKLRIIGEEFDCSKERYEEIIKVGAYVEPVQEKPDGSEEKEEPGKVQEEEPKEVKRRARNKKTEQKEGDL